MGKLILILIVAALAATPPALAAETELNRAGDTVALETLRWREVPAGEMRDAEGLVWGRAEDPALARLDHASFALLSARLDWHQDRRRDTAGALADRDAAGR